MTPALPAAVPAPLGLRLIAALYDLLPLCALWFVAMALALAVSGGRLDARTLHGKLVVQALVLLASAAYYIASWARGGQSIGMRPWRLRVVDAAGRPVSVERAALRFGVALLSLSVCGLGFAWCLIDRQRRGWHDIAAGTVLVRLPPRNVQA